MTKERAAKIILDLINAGEAEYRNFSVEEIIAFKKAYVALNPEPITNADRIRAMTDEELAKHLWNIRNAERCVISDQKRCIMFDDCIACWLDWLKQEAE